LTRRGNLAKARAHPERLRQFTPDLIAGQAEIAQGDIVQAGQMLVLAADFHQPAQPSERPEHQSGPGVGFLKGQVAHGILDLFL
jgi:hypothetical protein